MITPRWVRVSPLCSGTAPMEVIAFELLTLMLSDCGGYSSFFKRIAKQGKRGAFA